MPKTLPYVALAAAIALASPALAQTTKPTKEAAPQTAAPTSAQPPASSTAPAPPPSAAPPAPSSEPAASPPASATAPSGTDAAANAGASTLMSGMSVKDSTGALIGEVKSVKGSVATIQMGADSFTVDSNKLGVANGAATINATQAELKKMLPKK